MTTVTATTSPVVAPVRASLLQRARARLARVLVALAFIVGVPVSAAHAAPPAPPAVGTTVQSAAGQLSNGLIDGFVDILPYTIPVLIVFTVVAYVWKMLSAKKTAR